ncbi:MAG TPA: HD domain-containing protein [Geopsychrobacteraceae bacterium]|nr:HD domain-containing protein [Geopsychrobacteraceae bacterium]
MKQIYVEQIRERDQLDEIFLVRDKIMAMAKNGKPYMTMKLMDRTGEVEARVWDRVDEFSRLFDRDDFIRVFAKGNVYMGKMQIVVQNIQKVDEESVDLGDFLPVSGRDQQEMLAELQQILGSLNDPWVEKLLRAFFDDPDFYKRYSHAPAAKAMHHVFLGGLLEHSLAVAALASDIAARYPQVNRNLLIAGALLHDVGKVAELSYERSFNYTDEGKLLGHIMIGVEMIETQIRKLDGFPTMTGTLIKHLLLSHHGQYEFGSPKRPKTLEAVILNFIDDLDSKINGIQTHVDRQPDRESDWTNYHRLYDRYFYSPIDRESLDMADAEVPVAPAPEKRPDRSEPARRKRDEPLGFTLAEQLKGKNLDLFSTRDDKDRQ